jgi:protein-histidine N-methyltransferase
MSIFHHDYLRIQCNINLSSSPTNTSFQLATLPDHLCYSTIQIESPTGKTINLPRRALSDIRVQLMAEDEAANDETLNDIEDSDIRTGVYEGGFKTWECSVDLASILLDRGPRKDIDELVRCDQIVEVRSH